jgi:hypothetical protein
MTSMTAAFVLGIKTAGDVQPVINPTRAGGTIIDGDLNANGILDAADAELALQVALGYIAVTPQMLEADPDHDFKITIEDSINILDRLQSLPIQPQVRF